MKQDPFHNFHDFHICSSHVNLHFTFARHVGGLWLAMAPQMDGEAYSFTNRVTLKLGTSQKWNPGRNPAK